MARSCPECGSKAELDAGPEPGDKQCPECGMVWKNLDNVDDAREKDPKNSQQSDTDLKADGDRHE